MACRRARDDAGRPVTGNRCQPLLSAHFVSTAARSLPPQVVERATTPGGAEYVRVLLGGGSGTGEVEDASAVIDAEFLFLPGQPLLFLACACACCACPCLLVRSQPPVAAAPACPWLAKAPAPSRRPCLPLCPVLPLIVCEQEAPS